MHLWHHIIVIVLILGIYDIPLIGIADPTKMGWLPVIVKGA